MGNLRSEEKISPGIIAVDRRVSSKRGVSYRLRLVDRRISQDRRASKRSIVAFPVEIEVLYPFRRPLSKKIKGEAINVSNKGLSVVLEESVTCGVVVNLRLNLSSHYALTGAKAQIIWTGFALEGDKFRCGLRFLGFSNDYRLIISDSKCILKRENTQKRERHGPKIRQARFKDIKEILRIEREAWPKGLQATKEMFHSRLKTFPEGFLCVVVNGKTQGFVVTEILDYDIEKSSLSWQEVTDHGYIRKTHNSKGDTLYGVSLSISTHAGRKVTMSLLEAAGKLVIKYGLNQVLFGSRIPRYHKYESQMSVKKYIKSKTRTGRLLDPELAMYQSIGLRHVKIIPSYIKDPESLDYGILVVWKNPFLDLTKLFPFWVQLISSFIIRRKK